MKNTDRILFITIAALMAVVSIMGIIALFSDTTPIEVELAYPDHSKMRAVAFVTSLFSLMGSVMLVVSLARRKSEQGEDIAPWGDPEDSDFYHHYVLADADNTDFPVIGTFSARDQREGALKMREAICAHFQCKDEDLFVDKGFRMLPKYEFGDDRIEIDIEGHPYVLVLMGTFQY